VLTGAVRRPSPDEITVFDSTGLSIMDLAAAHLAIGKGKVIDLPFMENSGMSDDPGVRE
jgi:alanine dehydrogenase